MKKIINYMLAITLCLSFSQCKDYLNTSSPASTDDAFVTSTTSETFKSLAWCYANYRQNCAMAGYSWNEPIGSDAEMYPEANSPNNIMAKLKSETLTIDGQMGSFDNLNSTLARASKIADVIASKPAYQADVAAGKTTDWTQLYGEAIAMRAFCYFNLVKHFGDIPYGLENSYVVDYSLSSRFDIYDKLIASLKEVEPFMYKIGDGSITAERISRTYVNALIGEIAFFSAGYQTIRTDVQGLYGDVQFTKKGNEERNCVYARRNDYLSYYQIAEQYLQNAYNVYNGTAKLITTDARSYANNPFQMHFQNMLNFVVSPESLFELGNIQNASITSEYGYAFGRPSNGGSNNAAPVKCFAAIRIVPTVYYGEFENGDKRRDASVAVTGSTGTGYETMLSFAPGSKIAGGIATNKWDDNRMSTINTTVQRASGLNWPILRMADVMLRLALVKAELGGKDQEAMDLLNIIRQRAFGNTNHNISGLTGQALIDAILQERKLELLGEGTRRWDLILSGQLPTRAIAVQNEMKSMVADLKSQGYHQFANGNVISNYIYIDTLSLTPSLTYDCTTSADSANALRYPGWRGQFNWSSLPAIASLVKGTRHNVAIQGLFNYIDPAGPVAALLVSNKYRKINWAIDIVNNAAVYYDNLFGGLTSDQQPPRYLWPIPSATIVNSKGKITNGYGLANP